MRVNFSANSISCQPLRNFGKSSHSNKNNPPENTSNPAFSSNTVSREEYEKLNAKYDLLARFAVAQADQYNALAAKYRAMTAQKVN